MRTQGFADSLCLQQLFASTTVLPRVVTLLREHLQGCEPHRAPIYSDQPLSEAQTIALQHCLSQMYVQGAHRLVGKVGKVSCPNLVDLDQGLVYPLNEANLRSLEDLYVFRYPDIHQSVGFLTRHATAMAPLLPLHCSTHHQLLTAVLDILIQHEVLPLLRLRPIHVPAHPSKTLPFQPFRVPHERYFTTAQHWREPAALQAWLLQTMTRLERLETTYQTFLVDEARLLDPPNEWRLRGSHLKHPWLNRLFRRRPGATGFTLCVTRYAARPQGLFVYGAQHVRQVIGPNPMDWLFLKEEWMPVFWQRMHWHWVAYFYRYHYRQVHNIINSPKFHQAPAPATEAWTWPAGQTPAVEPEADPPDFPPLLTSTGDVHPMLWVTYSSKSVQVWSWMTLDVWVGCAYEPIHPTGPWSDIWTQWKQVPPEKSGDWARWLSQCVLAIIQMSLQEVLVPETELVEDWEAKRPEHKADWKQVQPTIFFAVTTFTQALHRKLAQDWPTIRSEIRQATGPAWLTLHWDQMPSAIQTLRFINDAHGLRRMMPLRLAQAMEDLHVAQWQLSVHEEDEEQATSLVGTPMLLRRRTEEVRQYIRQRVTSVPLLCWRRMQHEAWYGTRSDRRLQDFAWLHAQTHPTLQEPLQKLVFDQEQMLACWDMLTMDKQFETKFVPEICQWLQDAHKGDWSLLHVVWILWFETMVPGNQYDLVEWINLARKRLVHRLQRKWDDEGRWIGGGRPERRGRQRHTRIVTPLPEPLPSPIHTGPLAPLPLSLYPQSFQTPPPMSKKRKKRTTQSMSRLARITSLNFLQQPSTPKAASSSSTTTSSMGVLDDLDVDLHVLIRNHVETFPPAPRSPPQLKKPKKTEKKVILSVLKRNPARPSAPPHYDVEDNNEEPPPVVICPLNDVDEDPWSDILSPPHVRAVSGRSSNSDEEDEDLIFPLLVT